MFGVNKIPLNTCDGNFLGFPAFLNHKFIGCSRNQLLTLLGTLSILTQKEI